MRRYLRKRPSPGTVMGALALFISLSGATYAATGGNFILGQANTATSQTALSSDIASAPTLNVVNSGGRPAARFQANGGTAPFTVSNSTKVANLNGDLLDGIDSGGFVIGANGRLSHVRRTMSSGQVAVLLTLPGFVELGGDCNSNGNGFADFTVKNLSTAPIDFGNIESALARSYPGEGPTIVMRGGSLGDIDMVQVGQAYRVFEGGPVRTRMVTFYLSGSLSSGTCLFQAQALAQG